MKEKNDEQLRHVLQNPSHYSSEEIATAEEILEERTGHPVSLKPAVEENKKSFKSYNEMK